MRLPKYGGGTLRLGRSQMQESSIDVSYNSFTFQFHRFLTEVPKCKWKFFGAIAVGSSAVDIVHVLSLISDHRTLASFSGFGIHDIWNSESWFWTRPASNRRLSWPKQSWPDFLASPPLRLLPLTPAVKRGQLERNQHCKMWYINIRLSGSAWDKGERVIREF